MRTKFNLNLVNLDKFSVLVQGLYNVGKTHLLGDMLRSESQYGPVRYMCHVDEGDERGGGWVTVASFGLGEVGERVATYQDMLDFLADCRKEKVHALGIDGLRPLYNAILVEVVGEPRLPDSRAPAKGGDGEFAVSMWGQASFKMEQWFGLARTAANIVMATVPSHKSEVEKGGIKAIMPDLYGRLAQACIGRFDFAGYLTARMIGAGKAERRISFAPRADVLNRQRLAHPVLTDILIPDSSGGWEAIKAAFQRGMGKEVPS